MSILISLYNPYIFILFILLELFDSCSLWKKEWNQNRSQLRLPVGVMLNINHRSNFFFAFVVYKICFLRRILNLCFFIILFLFFIFCSQLKWNFHSLWESNLCDWRNSDLLSIRIRAHRLYWRLAWPYKFALPIQWWWWWSLSSRLVITHSQISMNFRSWFMNHESMKLTHHFISLL